jgi:hypothetical protein
MTGSDDAPAVGADGMDGMDGVVGPPSSAVAPWM